MSFNRRKRGAEDDEEGHGGFRSKKRRTNEHLEIEDRLESLILRVGEKSTSSLESNLEGLASVLEADLSTYKSKILKILVECAVKLPDKCTIYTTLIGLLNTKNYNFGGECVELLVKSTKDCLKGCRWSSARYLLRFLADLVNCHVVSAGSLLQLLDNFVDAALEEGVPQVRRDWFAYSVLSALPWVGRELYEKKESELDRMLGSLEGYIKRRRKIHHSALRVFLSDHPHPQEEYLDCLWHQIKRLRSDMWIEKHIIRPYLAFDSVLCEALQHNLSGLVPPPHHPSTLYPLPTVVFRMFDYTDCPEGPILPGQHSIERWLIEEQLTHILMAGYKERKECAAQLLSYPLKNKIPLEYIIVEVMFGQIFRLPNPLCLEIAYGSILIELCKLQPSTMPQVLAQATELLYERIGVMNVACFDRFVTWFSYHLSNFQFRWSWDDWDEALTQDPEQPKAKFIREVLQKCLRLSYSQRVTDIVPESFSGFLPDKPDPLFKFAVDGQPGFAASSSMVAAIKNKSNPTEVLEMLREVESDSLRIDVFTQSLLYLGHKSFSHSFAAIAKFHPVFKALADTEEAQICVLRSTWDLWKSHQQMLVVLVDKLLKTGIVECAAVANWVFSKEMVQEFSKVYVWEVVNITIRKMNKHVAKLSREASDARRMIEDSESESSDSEGEEGGGKGRRGRNRPTEKPSEEAVEKLEERLEAAQADQKNLFLIIFQRFIMILSEHLVRCDTDAVDFKSPWYLWTVGRLHQIFMLHHEQVERYSTTLETLLFTQDLDPNILDVFHQFVALRM
eukprot:TRINITY_DN2485_c0_g1_i1.p1 TRINITY_DN2485_c0_g1~~TRINITY_DN2485_c0_g1_i1.p1  ORF type:complete len:790 (+),score=272.47 TRINITY_DN2485_c0_g1_i1:36-2405(+)